MAATVGGTMVSRILGLSKWGGPISAYMELTGEPDTTPRNTAMSRGVALEASVLAMLGEREGVTVIRPATPRIAEENYPALRATMPHAHATLDAVAHERLPDGTGIFTVVDAKTASREEMGDAWGLDGTDKIPVEYHLQLLWYIGVCRAAGMNVTAYALLPTLVGPEAELQWAARLVTKTGHPLTLADLEGTGLELRVYRVAWDAALFEEVNARVVRFLREHVEPRVPPEPTAADLAERDVRAVARGFRAEPGKALDFEALSGPDQALLLELLEANRQRKAWAKQEEQAEARVKLAMGMAEEVRGLPGGARVAWKERQTGMRVFQVHEPRRK